MRCGKMDQMCRKGRKKRNKNGYREGRDRGDGGGEAASIRRSDSLQPGPTQQKMMSSAEPCGKKQYRWSLELLHTAVCGHRWDEALHLLPCVITQTASHITMESLWRLTDVITRNVPGIGMDERKTYWSLMHRMKLKSSMFLDILSQDLPKATDRDADELLQMIEDIQNQRQHVTTGTHAQANRRSQGLCDGYVGIIHFNRWKNSASQPSHLLDDLSQTQQSVFELQNPSWERKEKARTAHAYLRKALKGLDEPCEWFMLQFLEVEKELHGQDSAIRVLEEYMGEERRAPAHHLAYHFYRTLVPGSTQQQLTQLECIIKESPDDPLVVETVNLYLRTLDVGGGGAEGGVVCGHSDKGDSGLEDSNDSLFSAEPTTEITTEITTEATTEVTAVTPCTLNSRWRVKVLYKSVMVLVATLDFPNRVWDLAPWQKLTQVMRHFYMAWLRCWSCWSCRSTRSRIHRLAGTIVPLWRHYVWRDPPSTLPLHKARVLFHHVFAAFIFGYSEDYMKQCLAVLQASGHLRLLEELISLMNFRGPSLKNFTWSAEKNRRSLVEDALQSLQQLEAGVAPLLESAHIEPPSQAAEPSSCSFLLVDEGQAKHLRKRRKLKLQILKEELLAAQAQRRTETANAEAAIAKAITEKAQAELSLLKIKAEKAKQNLEHLTLRSYFDHLLPPSFT